MMDWNRIQAQWKRQSDPTAPDASTDLAEPGRLWLTIRRRDWIESLVGVLLAPFFAFISAMLLLAGQPIPAIFGLWLTLVCVYIPLRLRRARKMIPEPDPGRAVIEFLRAERLALVGQRDLLNSVWRWYWGPVAVGAIGFYVSIMGWHWSSPAYVLVVLLFSAGIEYMNRKAVRRSIEPAIETVDQQIAEIEEHCED